ncbi:MAG: ABC transporter ATP-binding protein [Nitrososphaerales archaeon]|nr:ABC transporter ATP-binding protein [Nitrososphaerales archaeon]
MASFLEVRELSKSFGKLHALDGVTLDVDAKRVNILIGPNGSGKTTLINAVSGFYKPDSGRVTFDGTDITGFPPYKVYGLGLARTFQIPNLFGKLTVLENVLVAEKGNPGESFLKSLFKRRWVKIETDATERALKLLELLGLSKVWDIPALNLSGGQMKLLEMGRVLMSGAKLILLDEPISGVNPTLAHEIFGRILKLRDDLGVTFLIVEHRLDIALSYVDTVTAMAFGKVVAAGKPELVMADPKVVEAYLGA